MNLVYVRKLTMSLKLELSIGKYVFILGPWRLIDHHYARRQYAILEFSSWSMAKNLSLTTDTRQNFLIGHFMVESILIVTCLLIVC